jgi:predicted ester cyclase
MSMSAAWNKVLACRLLDDAWNGDLGVFDRGVTEDFQIHFAAGCGEVLGIAGAKELVTDLHAARKGFHCRVEDLIAEGDRVAARLTYSGQGTALSKIVILRMQGDRVAEAWEDYDPLPILRRNATSP